MLKRQSALAAVYHADRRDVKSGLPEVSICERRGMEIVQISGWQHDFESLRDMLASVLNGALPDSFRKASSIGSRSVFRIGPERFWITGQFTSEDRQALNHALPGFDGVVTEIGHSRTVVRVSGLQSHVLLNRELPIDLDPGVFEPNAFAQSSVHHIPVLVHRVDISDQPVFDAYISREFAVAFWEWLIEAAAPLGFEINQPV